MLVPRPLLDTEQYGATVVLAPTASLHLQFVTLLNSSRTGTPAAAERPGNICSDHYGCPHAPVHPEDALYANMTLPL